MPKAVLFDIDGTLIDSTEAHVRSWIDAFRERGRDLEFEQVRSQMGKGSDQLLPNYLSEAEVEEFGESLSTRKKEIFFDRYFGDVRAFPAAKDLIQRVKASGMVATIASSADESELTRYIDRLGVDGIIDDTTHSDDVERSKPHPDIFHAALRQLPADAASDVLVVGDSPYDAEAASKAGLRTIGLLSGGFAEDVLRAAGCIAIYRDPADLLEHFDDSPLAAGDR